MNEVLVVNPRRKRNSKGQFIKRVKASSGHRRRRRRNPVAAVASLAANPRRKRRRGKWFAVKAHQRNPVHRHHRARRRNPVSLAAFRPKSIINELIPAAIGGAGAVALDVALSHIPMPAFAQNSYGKFAVRVVGAIGLGMLAGMVKKNIGRQVTAGALTVVAYNTLRDVVQRIAPQVTMAGYMDDQMGYIDPAPQLMDGVGMGAYMSRATPGANVSGMGAYMQPDASAMGNYGDGM